MNGEENEAKRRRNAFANALISLMPEVGAGKKTVHAAVRTAMYAIAPVHLWQFFSSQGKSGTSRCSFVTAMPNIYKGLMTAVASKSKLDQTSVVSAIADVVRSCQNRAGSKAYRQQHPELFATAADASESNTQEESDSESAEGSPASSPSPNSPLRC